MSSLNKVCLIGRLGKDPEIRSTQDGREIASFSMATSESWRSKDTGDRVEKTEWHRISVFSEGLVKVIKAYVSKGSRLYVEGKLQTRQWSDKDGIERYTTEVVLQDFDAKLVLLDGKPKDDDGGYAKPSGRSQRQAAPPSHDDAWPDDDLPF